MYQYQFAAVPMLPPEILIVAVDPGQIGEVPVTEIGCVEKEFIEIVKLTQVEVLHVPCALT